MKIGAVIFDVLFVILATYILFVTGIRLLWSYKSKRLRGKELPPSGEFVRLSKGKGVIYIYAPNCRPCKVVEPIIKKLSKEFKKVSFVRVDASKNTDLVRKLGVLATPTIILTENGKISEILVGIVSEKTLREVGVFYRHTK